jgi:hypothetical protein
MADNNPGRTVITLEAVLPPRPTTPVLTSSTLPCIKGSGHRHYSCPGCRRIILEGIESDEVEKARFSGVRSAAPILECPSVADFL